MGISRDSRHKRRNTGGAKPAYRKKRRFDLGRQPAMTKIGAKSIHLVRCHGGMIKKRALKLDTGNFSWASEGISCRTRILNVVYNATNNELVRTNTLVKNCIVVIDANPFRNYYLHHYGKNLGKNDTAILNGKEVKLEVGKSKATLAKYARNSKGYTLEQNVADQFLRGNLYACISSRPGQSGRADGYILEGKELEFYLKKLNTKK